MPSHECNNIMSGGDCALEKDVKRAIDHVDGSSERQKVILDRFNQLEVKLAESIPSVKVYILQGVLSAIGGAVVAVIARAVLR